MFAELPVTFQTQPLTIINNPPALGKQFDLSMQACWTFPPCNISSVGSTVNCLFAAHATFVVFVATN